MMTHYVIICSDSILVSISVTFYAVVDYNHDNHTTTTSTPLSLSYFNRPSVGCGQSTLSRVSQEHARCPSSKAVPCLKSVRSLVFIILW